MSSRWLIARSVDDAFSAQENRSEEAKGKKRKNKARVQQGSTSVNGGSWTGRAGLYSAAMPLPFDAKSFLCIEVNFIGLLHKPMVTKALERSRKITDE